MDQAAIRDRSRLCKEWIWKGDVGKRRQCIILIFYKRNNNFKDFGELTPDLPPNFSF